MVQRKFSPILARQLPGQCPYESASARLSFIKINPRDLSIDETRDQVKENLLTRHRAKRNDDVDHRLAARQ